MKTAATVLAALILVNALVMAARWSYGHHQQPAAAPIISPQEMRIQQLERQVARQQQFLDENTQSPHWNAPISVAEDRRLHADGDRTINNFMAGPGVPVR